MLDQAGPHPLETARQAAAARLLILVPAVFALVVLVGWWIDNDSLRRLGLASVTMNPTTAISFLMLSLGLCLRQTGGRVASWLAHGLIVGAGVIGVLKLLDVVAGTHIEIDTFLFAGKLATSDLKPSRIAPNAALCLVLISLALSAKTGPSRRAAIMAQLLALATMLVSVFALVGYLYGVGAFYSVPAFFPMAVHTAIGFLCLAAWVFLRTRTRGLMAPISDTGPAGRMARALLPAAFIIPVGNGWLRLLGERAGLFDAGIGAALGVMLNVLVLTVLIWLSARLLLASDTSRRQAEAELARMASYDFLTGLPNRAQFMERLMTRMAAGRRRTADPFAIIYMDLDGFKQVNDRLGHAIGDQLLRDVATHLRQCVRRDGDLVARLGGDEFTMLLDQVASADEASAVATRIVEEMPPYVRSNGQDVPVGMSVGIVLAEVRHQTPEALLSDADQALYDAKRGGKGRYAIFVGQADAASVA
jgi:diguanylate cyclase (GGDEF)-like protein